MFESMTKRVRSRTFGLVASLGLLALAAAAQGNAACLNVDRLLPTTGGMADAANFVPAVYRPGTDTVADFQPVHDSNGASIVGLWQFKMDGFSVDWGTQAWHSDGTEFMFSAAQNPETGDVCQGVWRKVGRSTYTLNHIAMAWLAPGAGFGLRIHFHMIVKLNAAGTAFTGTYTATVYSVGETDPFDESQQIVSGTGTVTASRVNPD